MLGIIFLCAVIMWETVRNISFTALPTQRFFKLWAAVFKIAYFSVKNLVSVLRLKYAEAVLRRGGTWKREYLQFLMFCCDWIVVISRLQRNHRVQTIRQSIKHLFALSISTDLSPHSCLDWAFKLLIIHVHFLLICLLTALLSIMHLHFLLWRAKRIVGNFVLRKSKLTIRYSDCQIFAP